VSEQKLIAERLQNHPVELGLPGKIIHFEKLSKGNNFF
jgi:hypothetical protein